MRQVRTVEEKKKEEDFLAYKKLRNLRRGKSEKINSEKIGDNIIQK